jgi:arginase
MSAIAVLDAPSNLGLRPPTANSVPGCAKAPGALRDQGLVSRLGARDAGCLTPPRFDPGDWRPGDGVSQAADIARYSVRLADRIGAILNAGEFPLILGGDCSVALGSALAMKRLADERGGRIGLIYVDAHSDFRHPGNATVVGAAAGEALALVTGRGQGELAGLEQRRPYVRDGDVVLLGMRQTDEHRMDLQAGGFNVRTAQDMRAHGANRTAQWARGLLGACLGYWVHLDVDVLDPSVMPAVDAPAPGGVAYPELEMLLRGLLSEPECVGIEVTVFDPDFDVDGVYAQDLVNTLVSALGTVGTGGGPRPLTSAAVGDDSSMAIPAQSKRPRTRRTPATS